MIPGRSDTLRVNGRARLLRDAPFFERMIMRDHRPKLVLLVEIDQIFFHCPKAFLRSQLWRPEAWNVQAMPAHAVISQTLQPTGASLKELERYYGVQYEERLYEDR